MSAQSQTSEILNEKAGAGNSLTTVEEDGKQTPVVVIDEDERTILRKIDLQ